MHEFKFVKMNGLGNDFIVIDQRVSEFDLSEEQIKLICNRTDGVGCDQLIMIRKSQDNSDPLIKFFNSDGGEIDACGNGSRCVANFLMKETKREKINLTTRERTIACEKIDDVRVSVNMGKPKFKWNEIPLTEDIDPVDINFSIRALRKSLIALSREASSIEPVFFKLLNISSNRLLRFSNKINSPSAGSAPMGETR